MKVHLGKVYVHLLNFLLAIDGILSMNPFFLWSGYKYNGIFDLLKKMIEILILLLFFLNKRYRRRLTKEKLLLIITFATIYVYYNLNCYPGTFNLTIGLFSKFFIILIFLLLSPQEKRDIFTMFSILFAVSLLPGIICLFLTMIGIPLNYDIIISSQAIKANSAYSYFHYFGCVFFENRYESSTFKLLCAMYDEHGMVGTISGLILIAEQFKISKKWHLKTILIGGILSMSLAFFLITMLYGAFILIREKNYKTLLTICCISILVLVVLFAFRDNDFVRRFVINRLNIRYLLENHRAEQLFKTEYSNFLKTSKIFFGNGINNPYFDSVDAASYQVMIYNIGFIGTLLYIGWFVMWGVKYSKKDINSLILVFFFFLSFLQRPWIIYLYFMIILFGGISKNTCYSNQEN